MNDFRALYIVKEKQKQMKFKMAAHNNTFSRVWSSVAYVCEFSFGFVCIWGLQALATRLEFKNYYKKLMWLGYAIGAFYRFYILSHVLTTNSLSEYELM